ncbi:peptidase [Aliiglaciecola sp. CAU 1673]|uniref:PepSY domain-containing protein n=1 Tax=Aliiglaciecola sp. CAU 1673 TaxID=3032595 RepID=UPI0023DCADA9|nr:peptidase [Aliiglaciecola sp. CAU 1673]MDF2178819.1 peptidase [Aliiglaciecola sp. CAU 1673]
MRQNAVKGLLVLWLFALPLHAQERDQVDMGEAAQRAAQQVDGRVLKVDDARDKYRVKVLQKTGRVVTVDVDKKSGKVSKPKQG